MPNEKQIKVHMTLADLRGLLNDYRKCISDKLDSVPTANLPCYDVGGGIIRVDKAAIHNEVINKAPLPKEFLILLKYLDPD